MVVTVQGAFLSKEIHPIIMAQVGRVGIIIIIYYVEYLTHVCTIRTMLLHDISY